VAVVNLADVYTEIENRLKTIPKLNVPPIEAETITPDAVLWSLPEKRDYQGAYGGGMEEFTIELTVCISKNSMRGATQKALEYSDPEGARSIRQAINSTPAKPYASCDEVTVQESQFDTVRVGETDYVGVIFAVQVAGSGGTRE
jgi:hypothetical protein